MTRALAVLALVLLTIALAAASAAAQGGADARVDAIAERLRCPVCQNQSVRESPSEVAQVFRERIRELVAAGRSDREIEAFFVERYGDWILLSPPKEGIALAVWVVPLVLLAVGLAIVTVTVRRWTARARRLEGAGRADPVALAQARARVAGLEQDLPAP